MTGAGSVSAVVITRDAAPHLDRCLQSLQWAGEIVVVDGGSRDTSLDIARRHGARVIEHPFDDFASQRNRAAAWARGDWILMVDADEEVTAALRDEIAVRLQQATAAAFWIPRRNVLFGAVLAHGDQWPDWQLRLYRRGAGRYVGAVHERLVVDGAVARLRAALLHHSTATIGEYLRKLRQYTALESTAPVPPAPVAALVLRPPAVFLRSYVWRRGFLDGYRGFLVAALAAFYAFVTLARRRRWDADPPQPHPPDSP
jgi:glycosyltransferase involved in cell wall biosynthesis